MQNNLGYRVGRVILLGLVVFLVFEVAGAQENLKKKIIEFGWDIPSPAFVRDHIREMEARPFDGVVFRTKDFNHIFDTRPWTANAFKPDMDALSAIKWGTFTDNFLILYTANNRKMDWFDNAQWKVIEANMQSFSKAVMAGRCVGVCFDQEAYGDDPWIFTGNYPGKTFEEVAAQVRIRGGQFMRALQSATPTMKMLNFFQLTYFGDTDQCQHIWRNEKQWNILTEADPVVRMQKLSERPYALYCSFFIGMLEAAGPGVTFIDGNELAYYYDSPYDFYYHYHEMKQTSLNLVPETLRPKYIAQTQAGNAVYFDILMVDAYGKERDVFVPSDDMTHAERLKFLEHNVYYALTTADEYFWFYTEKANWWSDLVPPDTADGPKNGVTADVQEAIVSARTKYEQGKPLGYDITEMVTRGWTVADKAYEERKKKQ